MKNILKMVLKELIFNYLDENYRIRLDTSYFTKDNLITRIYKKDGYYIILNLNTTSNKFDYLKTSDNQLPYEIVLEWIKYKEDCVKKELLKYYNRLDKTKSDEILIEKVKNKFKYDKRVDSLYISCYIKRHIRIENIEK